MSCIDWASAKGQQWFIREELWIARPAGLWSQANWEVGDDCPDEGDKQAVRNALKEGWECKREGIKEQHLPLLPEHWQPLYLHTDSTVSNNMPVRHTLTHTYYIASTCIAHTLCAVASALYVLLTIPYQQLSIATYTTPMSQCSLQTQQSELLKQQYCMRPIWAQTQFSCYVAASATRIAEFVMISPSGSGVSQLMLSCCLSESFNVIDGAALQLLQAWMKERIHAIA